MSLKTEQGCNKMGTRKFLGSDKLSHNNHEDLLLECQGFRSAPDKVPLFSNDLETKTKFLFFDEN